MTGLALTTAKLLMHEGTGPICIGIEAPWGKGKSSSCAWSAGRPERQTEANPAAYELVPMTSTRGCTATRSRPGLAWPSRSIAPSRPGRSLAGDRPSCGATRGTPPRAARSGPSAAAVLAVALSVLVAWLAELGRSPASQRATRSRRPSSFSPALVGVILLLGVSYRLTRPVSQRVHDTSPRPDHACGAGYQNDVVSDLRFTLATLHRRHAERPGRGHGRRPRPLRRGQGGRDPPGHQRGPGPERRLHLLAIDGDMVRRAVFRHYRDAAEEKLPEASSLTSASRSSTSKDRAVLDPAPTDGPATRATYVSSLFTLPALGVCRKSPVVPRRPRVHAASDMALPSI